MKNTHTQQAPAAKPPRANSAWAHHKHVIATRKRSTPPAPSVPPISPAPALPTSSSEPALAKQSMPPTASSASSGGTRTAPSNDPRPAPHPALVIAPAPDAGHDYDPQALRNWADRLEADTTLYKDAYGDVRYRQRYILALRTLANATEKRHELDATIRANEAKIRAKDAENSALKAKISALKADRQRLEDELVRGAQQSGRRAEDGVLYRIREELLDLGLKVREDLTLEQLETEGLAYQINGCWILAWDYVVEIYLPAKRRARNADPAQ